MYYNGLLQAMQSMQFRITNSPLELNTSKSHLLKVHGDMISTMNAVYKPIKGQIKVVANLCVSADNRRGIDGTVKLNPSSRVDIKYLMNNDNNTLTGKFFLCRTIVPPFQMTSILIVVDDPEGDKAVRLALYDYPTKSRPLLQVLPVGTILAIKNPWFKSTMDGGYALRVDDPKNVVVLDEASIENIFPQLEWKGEIPEKYRHLVPKQKKPKPKKQKPAAKTAIDYKNDGNKFFVQKKYSQAVECYKQGLALEPNNIDILANRAASYLNLEYFHRALEDTEKVLSVDSCHFKGNYRKVKSLWGLKRYDEAISFLKIITTTKSEFASAAEFLELLSSFENLNFIRKTGKYDWPSFFEIQTKQVLDFADYCGAIEISSDIPGKGRGIIATDDISPGELLIVSKAFSIFTIEAAFNRDELELTTNFKEDLAKIVARKLEIEPECRNEVGELFSGPDLFPWTEKMNGGTIDEKRIQNICSFNAFNGNTNTDLERYKKTGLWILPSYINHSCWDSNCTWVVVGDVMIVRSYKSIPKGQEILISYINPLEDYLEREIELMIYKFVCQCTLCQEDRRESKSKQKKRKRILDYVEMCAGTADSLKTQISKLEALRSSAPTLNNVIVPPLLDLARMHFVDVDVMEGIAALEKGFCLLQNTPLVDEPLEYLLNIVVGLIALHANGQQVKSDIDKWVEILKAELLIRYGSEGVIKGRVGKEIFVITGDEYIGIMEGYGITFD